MIKRINKDTVESDTHGFLKGKTKVRGKIVETKGVFLKIKWEVGWNSYERISNIDL